MGFEVPVFYIDNRGKRVDDRINGQPCIEIGISWDSDAGHGRIPHPRTWETVVGLIDTGAQAILADDALVKRLSMPWTRSANSRTSNGVTPMRGHLCQLHFPSHAWTWRLEAFNSPLRDKGNPYDLVLGRVFLRALSFDWIDGGLSSVRVTAPTAPLIAKS